MSHTSASQPILSAVTVSLVEEARGGPFVFWNGLADAAAHASALGFDALEVFAPAADAVDVAELKRLCSEHGLQIAAFGTGAGMVKHGLSLTAADAAVRQRARDFIRSMMQLGAEFQAPAIIGSMQGRWTAEVRREQAVAWLSEGLSDLGAIAASLGVTLLYEPLNRYESNLFNTLDASRQFVLGLTTPSVKILADLFHMNIEEANTAASLRDAADVIGHIHFVDSHRRAAGTGQTDFAPIAAALKEGHFAGYLSAEAFPIPDSLSAAKATIAAFQRWFR